MIERLAAIDAETSRLVNGSWSNNFLDLIVPLISELGTGETVFLISLAAFVLRRRKDGGRLALLLLAGLTVTYYIVYFLKTFFGRPRPYMVLPHIIAFAGENSLSFPSNHAANAFMAATVISGSLGRWRLPLFFAAAAVAYSRIYMGVHYLSDVICGAAVGTIIGCALLYVSRPESSYNV